MLVRPALRSHEAVVTKTVSLIFVKHIFMKFFNLPVDILVVCVI